MSLATDMEKGPFSSAVTYRSSFSKKKAENICFSDQSNCSHHYMSPPKACSPESTPLSGQTIHKSVKLAINESKSPSQPKKCSIRLTHSLPQQQNCSHLVNFGHDAGLLDSKRLLVLKIGTSTILDTATSSFCLSNLGKFVDTVCHIKKQGYQVVLVSSGAVGAGVIHLKLKQLPATLQQKQAASAVGQCRMMRLYEDLFSIQEQKVAQLILTRSDLIDRTRFINLKNTLNELLNLGVVPIINENDSLATLQLRFGDNDTLAAYVAVSLGAQWLFLLTDVDCLYTKNPRLHNDAKPIPYVDHLSDVYTLLDDRENAGSSWGSGGMRTKILAAKIATATGIHTALCHGQYPERILDVIRFSEMHAQSQAHWGLLVKTWQWSKRASKSNSSSNNMLRTSKEVRNLQRDGPSSRTSRSVSPPKEISKLTTSASEYPLVVNNDEKADADPVDKKNAEQKVTHDSSETFLVGMITVPTLSDMPFLGTIFAAPECIQSIKDQRKWILSLPVRGRIFIDSGAARAIIEGKKSLFAAGISRVEGNFYEEEAIAIHEEVNDKTLAACQSSPSLNQTNSPARMSSHETKGTHHKSIHDKDYPREHTTPFIESSPENESELARCLVNFTSAELNKIKGLRSEKFRKLLGYECEEEVAHRHNIIFVNPFPVYGP